MLRLSAALITTALLFAAQTPARADNASYNACIALAAQVRDESIANGMPRTEADRQWAIDVQACSKYLEPFQPEPNDPPTRTGGSGTR